MMRMPFLASLICLLAATTPALPESHALQSQETATPATPPNEFRLRIGIRSQARPFSYLSETLRDVITDATPGKLAKSHYTGYIARICDEVLNQMILETRSKNALKATDIGIVDIDLLSAEADEPKSRFEYLRPSDPDEKPTFDVLCDPATITNDRRVGLIISAPIYLTGISYLQRSGTASRSFFEEDDLCPRPNSDGAKPSFLFGLVGNTTAGSFGIRQLIDANEIPLARDVLINYLKPDSPKCHGRGAKNADDLELDYKGGVRFFRTHAEAAEAFCRKEITYYIGDREIITAHANTHPDCDYVGGTQTYTTDRYAIFGRIDYAAEDPDRAMLVARFFEILSQKIVGHPSILDKAFDDTFHPSTPTRPLSQFFRAVRGAP